MNDRIFNLLVLAFILICISAGGIIGEAAARRKAERECLLTHQVELNGTTFTCEIKQEK